MHQAWLHNSRRSWQLFEDVRCDTASLITNNVNSFRRDSQVNLPIKASWTQTSQTFPGGQPGTSASIIWCDSWERHEYCTYNIKHFGSSQKIFASYCLPSGDRGHRDCTECLILLLLRRYQMHLWNLILRPYAWSNASWSKLQALVGWQRRSP